MIKLRRMTWAGHLAQMGGKTNAYSVLVGKPDVGRRVILKWIFRI
jgi:hypothetical protein